jgi:hypothetical protein
MTDWYKRINVSLSSRLTEFKIRCVGIACVNPERIPSPSTPLGQPLAEYSRCYNGTPSPGGLSSIALHCIAYRAVSVEWWVNVDFEWKR